MNTSAELARWTAAEHYWRKEHTQICGTPEIENIDE
jgi:hypothetical protein